MIHLITGKPGSGKTAFSAGLMSMLIAQEPEKTKREQARQDQLQKSAGLVPSIPFFSKKVNCG